MTGKDPGRPTWLRYSGIGFEFVAAVGVFALIGYWVDRRWQIEPWGLVIGVFLGLIGGMYNLIRESLAAFKPPTGERMEPPAKPS
jgi:F0F1-type ATP synthase assembly protein I